MAPHGHLRNKSVDRDLLKDPSDLDLEEDDMNTRGAAIATNDDRPRNDDRHRKAARSDAWRSAPQPGDILVSERSARADVFAISIIPSDSSVTLTRYSAAIERVRELARARRVDGWYTSDQTHYARIASHRFG